jgi:signal transduction histidine kinase
LQKPTLHLKWKFILIVMVIMIVINATHSVIFYRADIQYVQDSVQRKITTLASMIADNTTSSLQFQSKEDASEVLRTLANEPMVDGAYLFDKDGKVLANYLAKGQDQQVPAVTEMTEQLRLRDDRISLQKPIFLDNEVIGLIYLSANLTELRERRAERIQFSIIALLVVTLISLVVAVLGEHYFIKPIVSLSNLSRRIGEQQRYDLRADKTADDEIGELVDNFNQMLTMIEHRDSELVKKTKELTDSNRELEQFAYITSHDLKSPLVTIGGYTNRLEDYVANKEYGKIKKATDRIQRAVARMGMLIEDILVFSRIGQWESEREIVNLNTSLAQIVDDMKETIEAYQAKIVIEGLPLVKASASEVRQVFQNLLENALYHACQEAGKTITVGYQRLPDEYLVFVRDQGPGIAERFHTKIFQLFQRLDANEQGSGLGLAIVHKAMNCLSGRVWVESEEGKGATFWLAFPQR